MYVKFYREILFTILILLIIIPLAWYLLKKHLVKNLSDRVHKFRSELNKGDKAYFQCYINYGAGKMNYAFVKCTIVDRLSDTILLIHFKEPNKRFGKYITKHVSIVQLFPKYAIPTNLK
jgi:hypothetical protein